MTENATTTIVAVKYQKTAPHHTMNKDWEKEFDRIFVDENLWKSDDEFTANVPIENIKAFITEQRESAREEAVEYIKTHSKRLHMVGGYEVLDVVLEAAPTKE